MNFGVRSTAGSSVSLATRTYIVALTFTEPRAAASFGRPPWLNGCISRVPVQRIWRLAASAAAPVSRHLEHEAVRSLQKINRRTEPGLCKVSYRQVLSSSA
jgi:hypothetical protein